MSTSFSNETNKMPYPVQRWLREQGLFTASFCGIADGETLSTMSTYLIMKEPPIRPWWNLLLLEFFILRRDIIGMVTAEDEANYTRWRVEVYGEDNLPFMRRLAAKLSWKFKCDVHVALVSEHPGQEAFGCDWD